MNKFINQLTFYLVQLCFWHYKNSIIPKRGNTIFPALRQYFAVLFCNILFLTICSLEIKRKGGQLYPLCFFSSVRVYTKKLVKVATFFIWVYPSDRLGKGRVYKCISQDRYSLHCTSTSLF